MVSDVWSPLVGPNSVSVQPDYTIQYEISLYFIPSEYHKLARAEKIKNYYA
jgi:hypothetical protein